MLNEATGATRLRQIAHRMQALSAGAWSEAEDGTLRVELSSPQFGLRGFREDLEELARREGYTVTERRERGFMGRERRWLEIRPGAEARLEAAARENDHV